MKKLLPLIMLATPLMAGCVSANSAEGAKAGECYCKEGADGADCSGRPLCGDGLLQDAEACEDGNTDPGDGCDGLCSIE